MSGARAGQRPLLGLVPANRCARPPRALFNEFILCRNANDGDDGKCADAKNLMFDVCPQDWVRARPSPAPPLAARSPAPRPTATRPCTASLSHRAGPAPLRRRAGTAVGVRWIVSPPPSFARPQIDEWNEQRVDGVFAGVKDLHEVEVRARARRARRRLVPTPRPLLPPHRRTTSS